MKSYRCFIAKAKINKNKTRCFLVVQNIENTAETMYKEYDEFPFNVEPEKIVYGEIQFLDGTQPVGAHYAFNRDFKDIFYNFIPYFNIDMDIPLYTYLQVLLKPDEDMSYRLYNFWESLNIKFKKLRRNFKFDLNYRLNYLNYYFKQRDLIDGKHYFIENGKYYEVVYLNKSSAFKNVIKKSLIKPTIKSKALSEITHEGYNIFFRFKSDYVPEPEKEKLIAKFKKDVINIFKKNKEKEIV